MGISPSQRLDKTVAAVTVDTSYTDVLEIVPKGEMRSLHFDLTNAGSAALTDVRILAKTHPDGAYYTYMATIGQWKTAEPKTLAAAGISRFSIRCGDLYAVKLQAKCGSSTTVTCLAMVSEHDLDPDQAGSRKVVSTSKVAAQAGGANKVALAAASTPYTKATVYAWTPGSGTANPTTNTDWVYISAENGDQGDSFPLMPGASMPLPDNGDLADFDLSVDTGTEGVVILYTP